MSKTFKLATFNANSIRSRIHIIIPWLEVQSPDVLCLQETKVQDKDFPADAIEDAGYLVIYKGQKSYNGVAIISKMEPTNVIVGLGDGIEVEEARHISAEYDGIRVINTYIPQGQSVDSLKFQHKLEWFKRLRLHFEHNFDPTEKIVWTGDLNIAPEAIDVHDPKKLFGHVCYHPKVQMALSNVLDWGFLDVFRKFHPEPEQYTYWDYRVRNAVKRKVGWRIDHIYTTKPLADLAVNSYIDIEPRLKEKPSDHTFLVAEFEV